LPINSFVKVGTDDTVTILSKHIEFGQGPFTGLATLVAEELDADWSQMRAVHSPADDKIYANLMFGMQGTGGSTAIANSYEQYRQAGATARAMLVAAAAEEWGVPAGEIAVTRGVISHKASGKTSGLARWPTRRRNRRRREAVALKDPKDFVLIGKVAEARHRGEIHRQGSVHARRAGRRHDGGGGETPDHFGATVKSFDDAETRKVAGVVDVKQVGSGVAVYANDTYSALKGATCSRSNGIYQRLRHDLRPNSTLPSPKDLEKTG
jgi:isoquinoline 1-oxidoreductase beta subunit